MPTQTKENYLKAIYFIAQESDEITLTQLARVMEVNMSSANNMVKKLKDKGWVNYEKYKPLLLSDEGIKQAALIVRKHRLTEMFLAHIMKFGWEEVHEIAEELEHIKNEQFFDRMDELLNFPKVDPHGSPIPDKNGKLPDNLQGVPLSTLLPGQRAQLLSVSDTSHELLVYLNKKHIALGVIFEVEGTEVFDQSMQICYDIYRESLSKKVCEHLQVIILE